MPEVLVLIPARMASTRLPGKPLADIHGTPMIVHVWRRAVEADIGRVIVATDDVGIAGAVLNAGGEMILTRADHDNGTSRIHEAVSRVDPQRQAEIIVNVQGDLPAIDPASLKAALLPLADPAVDIGTIAAEIVRAEERASPHVVKVVGTPVGPRLLRALYFTRATAPYGEGPL